VIFNAVIIVALVPLALRGIRYRPVGAAALLRSNLLIYGVGGIVVPFIGNHIINEETRNSVAYVIPLSGFSFIAAVLILTASTAALAASADNSVKAPKSFIPWTIRSGSPFLSLTSGRVMPSSTPAIECCGTMIGEAVPTQTSPTRQAAETARKRAARTPPFYSSARRSARAPARRLRFSNELSHPLAPEGCGSGTAIASPSANLEPIQPARPDIPSTRLIARPPTGTTSRGLTRRSSQSSQKRQSSSSRPLGGLSPRPERGARRQPACVFSAELSALMRRAAMR